MSFKTRARDGARPSLSSPSNRDPATKSRVRPPVSELRAKPLQFPPFLPDLILLLFFLLHRSIISFFRHFPRCFRKFWGTSSFQRRRKAGERTNGSWPTDRHNGQGRTSYSRRHLSTKGKQIITGLKNKTAESDGLTVTTTLTTTLTMTTMTMMTTTFF